MYTNLIWVSCLCPPCSSDRCIRYLHSNPWHCDCNIKWLPSYLRLNVSEFFSQTANCATPTSLSGASIVSLSEDQLVCGELSSWMHFQLPYAHMREQGYVLGCVCPVHPFEIFKCRSTRWTTIFIMYWYQCSCC